MAAVDALQREEIDMAIADLKCAESWDDTYAEVRGEHEAAFIPANLELLEQIRDTQGG